MSAWGDAGLILSLVGGWGLVCIGLGHFGGWRALARHYPASTEFLGRRFRFRSAQFGGWVGYNASLTAGADPFGLFLAVWPIFRVWHPPLFVPWSDITVSLEQSRWLTVVLLTFAKVPGAKVRITPRLANRLAAVSRGGFRPGAA